MKKADIAMIILIASVSVMISYFVVSSIPGLQSSEQSVGVKVIDRYEPTIDDEPDPAVFADDAVNPTVQVTIGDSTSQDTDGVTDN